ncbi:MAG: tryptophan--tRNA ligase [Rickettsiales bacterium]|nr:tryptophan--tRNA ligase [Rickettsiales bacterium]
MTRVLSGVQPTGKLHLGNYLGAIRNWVDIQNTHESLFCIVDLHAITVAYDPKELRQSIRDVAAAYLACGIDPKKSSIFNQSSVSGHAELAWMLGCLTPLGWLNRMTQFKEKAGKRRENASLGLYGYPVLMAADILLYKATHVPVGEDQKQHLELTRDIAGVYNNTFKEGFFELPEPLILGEATRVMSLRDGSKKMSKSDDSDYSRINLTDDADEIYKKFKKAKSDMEPGITYDVEKRPEASNLLNIYATLSNKSRKDIEQEYASSGFAEFKKDLADLAVEVLSPITQEYNKIRSDHAYIDGILLEGNNKANQIAAETINDVKEAMGFIHF